MKHDYSNDKKYFTLSYRDETSMYDPHPSVRWEGGSEYYSRLYSCRVPIRIKNNKTLIDDFSERHNEDDGFWVD